jgi:hypothetical protein
MLDMIDMHPFLWQINGLASVGLLPNGDWFLLLCHMVDCI